MAASKSVFAMSCQATPLPIPICDSEAQTGATRAVSKHFAKAPLKADHPSAFKHCKGLSDSPDIPVQASRDSNGSMRSFLKPFANSDTALKLLRVLMCPPASWQRANDELS